MLLSVMAVCKALGARRVLAIDVQENRLNFAKNYVGCETHKAIPKTPEEDSISYAKRHVSLRSIFLLLFTNNHE